MFTNRFEIKYWVSVGLRSLPEHVRNVSSSSRFTITESADPPEVTNRNRKSLTGSHQPDYLIMLC